VRHDGPVASRMTELVLDCHDADLLAAFWCEVLGWVVTDRNENEVEIAPPDSASYAGPTMVLGRGADPKVEKLRLHIDLRPTDGDHAAELERLLAAGAVRADIGQGEDVRWAVLADPEGNEFCLLFPVDQLPS
jgi:predicted enzyme related to lactoylglutathione lyase